VTSGAPDGADRTLAWARDRLTGPMDHLDAAAVSAAALVSIAQSLEVIAAAQAQHAYVERMQVEEYEGDLFDSEPFRRTATVVSPYLMDVEHGHDEGTAT
jgi:hypothetical protein